MTEHGAAAISVAVDLAILTLHDGRFSALLVQRQADPYGGAWALPGGFVGKDEDLVDAAHRVLAAEASLGEGSVYLEQVITVGDPRRDPRGRIVSVVFMALGADLPDPVHGPEVDDARWWPVDELDTIELAFDHASILECALDRARSKLEYTTLATTFLPEEFTISQLRRVYEAVWGQSLDPGNFHRKATRSEGFVVELDKRVESTGGRPARLFRAGAGAQLNPPLLRTGT